MNSTTYTCPMHPEIIQDKAGNCPKCGMHLVPVKSQDVVIIDQPKSELQNDHNHHNPFRNE